MAAEPHQGLSSPASARTLSTEERIFFASVYDSARKGSLAELRHSGCSEEEGEEYFASAFERVMGTVDPVEREFSAPQMVNFIKLAAWRCMIDDRRRRGQRSEVSLAAVHSLSDMSAESPEEVAEEREAVAIGREALQMLSERDRVIFHQRHQMNLSPDEILQNMPGLSQRTYRKIIQRANVRVLDAFERIEGGARCEEMEASLLRRYVADESPEAERLEVSAHLSHCRACRRVQVQMRGYLFDVSSVLVLVSSSAGSDRLGLGDIPAHLADMASAGAQGLADATRAARERVREMLLRMAGAASGPGGDATIGQALTATSAKVASACAAAVTAGACVAAGVVPGVAGLGVLDQDADHGAKPPGQAKTVTVPEGASPIEAVPSHSLLLPEQGHRRKDSRRGGREGTGASSPTRSSRSAAGASPPSRAEGSGSVTNSEFGAEFDPPVLPPSSPPPSRAPSVPTPSDGGQPSGGSSQGASSEFGL